MKRPAPAAVLQPRVRVVPALLSALAIIAAALLAPAALAVTTPGPLAAPAQGRQAQPAPHEPPEPGGLPDPVPVQLAAGVYMVQAATGEVGRDNLGRIGNSGFVVGEKGVVAIDTGTSFLHGQALLRAIRRVTAKPVLLAVVTHTRQEFLFGATAFQQQGIPIHMQRAAAELMRARCERCLQALQGLLGQQALQDTALFQPEHVFDRSYIFSAAGRPLRVLYFGHSAGPGDVAVLDVQSGVLFAGGLLDNLRIPDVQDSVLAGWNAALQSLRALPIRRIVPGHGPAGGTEVIDSVARYLAQLQARVRALLQSGTSLLDVGPAAALPEFSGWDQYETIHRRNASVLFLRLEREHLLNQREPVP